MYKHSKHVLIPKSSLPIIKTRLEQYNSGLTKRKLKLDKVLLVYGYILMLLAKSNKEKFDRNHLDIHSKALEKIYYGHSKCTKFLVKNKLLHRLNYSKQYGKCNRYALHYNYFGDQLVMVNTKEISNISEDKAFKIVGDDNSIQKYGYLISFFNGISFDFEKAKKQIDDEFQNNTINEDQYFSYNYSISSINERVFYFRNPQTDKRLHTNLTGLSKILRKYLSYNGKPLINLDLKNSQPFFFAVLVNIICNKDIKILEQLKPVISNVKSNKASKSTNFYDRILKLFAEIFDNAELNRFISSACNGNYYELLASKVSQYTDVELISNKKTFVKYKYCPKKKERVKVYFSSTREFAKDSSMQIFFASEKSTVKDVTFFKNEFPSLWKLTKYLKEGESSNFAVLLQNLEAYLILDVVCKEISSKTSAPIFTIHDSIVTIPDYKKEVLSIFLKSIKRYTMLEPTINTEVW